VILENRQFAEVMVLDIALLPTGPLSMAGLLNLEPQPLRRLLKQGLRRGLRQEELDHLFNAEFGVALDHPDSQALLIALADRGWFLWNPEMERWKTHLG
jgi:hypothetical protein